MLLPAAAAVFCHHHQHSLHHIFAGVWTAASCLALAAVVAVAAVVIAAVVAVAAVAIAAVVAVAVVSLLPLPWSPSIEKPSWTASCLAVAVVVAVVVAFGVVAVAAVAVAMGHCCRGRHLLKGHLGLL